MFRWQIVTALYHIIGWYRVRHFEKAARFNGELMENNGTYFPAVKPLSGTHLFDKGSWEM